MNMQTTRLIHHFHGGLLGQQVGRLAYTALRSPRMQNQTLPMWRHGVDRTNKRYSRTTHPLDLKTSMPVVVTTIIMFAIFLNHKANWQCNTIQYNTARASTQGYVWSRGTPQHTIISAVLYIGCKCDESQPIRDDMLSSG